jgi:hypothetical protein
LLAQLFALFLLAGIVTCSFMITVQ